MVKPLLLLSVATSRDRSGPVTPTLGPGTTTTTGHFGDAWLADAAGEYVRVPNDGYIARIAGSMLFRVHRPESTSGGPRIFQYGTDGTAGLMIRYNGTNVQAFGYIPTATNASTAIGTAGDVDTIYVEWSGTTLGIAINDGALATTTSDWVMPSSGNLNLANGSSTSNPLTAPLESAVFYPSALGENERERLRSHDGPWTWDVLVSTAAPRPSRVFVLGSPHNIGPLRVGRR